MSGPLWIAACAACAAEKAFSCPLSVCTWLTEDVSECTFDLAISEDDSVDSTVPTEEIEPRMAEDAVCPLIPVDTRFTLAFLDAPVKTDDPLTLPDDVACVIPAADPEEDLESSLPDEEAEELWLPENCDGSW